MGLIAWKWSLERDAPTRPYQKGGWLLLLSAYIEIFNEAKIADVNEGPQALSKSLQFCSATTVVKQENCTLKRLVPANNS